MQGLGLRVEGWSRVLGFRGIQGLGPGMEPSIRYSMKEGFRVEALQFGI